MMCRLLRVSSSGYYAWRTHPESARTQQDRELTPKIRRVFEASKGVYGSPRAHAELAEEGAAAGRDKIARLMRLERLRGCPKRRFRTTTKRDPAHPVAKNLLKQNFQAQEPSQRWASDITYISTKQGWLYFAVVMDLFSRRIVGWSMSHRMGRRLAVGALTMAIDARRPDGHLIHRSATHFAMAPRSSWRSRFGGAAHFLVSGRSRRAGRSKTFPDVLHAGARYLASGYHCPEQHSNQALSFLAKHHQTFSRQI